MIETTLAYLIQDDAFLMLLRNKKENDINANKWIGVGGKIEEGESPLECIQREILEETGFQANTLEYRGIIDFYLSSGLERTYLYTCSDFSGEMKESDEGELAWIPKEKIFDLALWEGDQTFLKPLIEDDPSRMEIELYYDQNDCLTHTRRRI